MECLSINNDFIANGQIDRGLPRIVVSNGEPSLVVLIGSSRYRVCRRQLDSQYAANEREFDVSFPVFGKSLSVPYGLLVGNGFETFDHLVKRFGVARHWGGLHGWSFSRVDRDATPIGSSIQSRSAVWQWRDNRKVPLFSRCDFQIAWQDSCERYRFFATTITPLVSRSRRCTIPGRCFPPHELRFLKRNASAAVSVPDQWPFDG